MRSTDKEFVKRTEWAVVPSGNILIEDWERLPEGGFRLVPMLRSCEELIAEFSDPTSSLCQRWISDQPVPFGIEQSTAVIGVVGKDVLITQGGVITAIRPIKT